MLHRQYKQSLMSHRVKSHLTSADEQKNGDLSICITGSISIASCQVVLEATWQKTSADQLDQRNQDLSVCISGSLSKVNCQILIEATWYKCGSTWTKKPRFEHLGHRQCRQSFHSSYWTNMTTEHTVNCDAWRLSSTPTNTKADSNLLCLNAAGSDSILVSHFQVAPGNAQC